MVRVKGPLFSGTATGTLGNGQLQFKNAPGGPQAILPALARPRRASRPTATQSAIREAFRGAAHDWGTLDAAARDAWSYTASRAGLANGFTAYVRQSLNEHAANLAYLTCPDGSYIVNAEGSRLSI